jgi:hypothetical protein
MKRLLLTFAALLFVLPATAASAATVTSSNWAGYAATGKKFRHVAGTWIVPTGTCESGTGTYSAAWVGLGGYSKSSRALEQTGTEIDCSTAGRATYSAWYELVPAPSKAIRMTVRPGDTMSASADVRGRRVILRLRDVTRGTSFAKTTTISSPDVSSAEWIIEAPSGCDSSGGCQQLPLGNFGTIGFAHARATTAAGHVGTISDSAWSATKLNLSQNGSGGGRFNSVSSARGALASALSSGGSAFSVSYSSSTGLAKPTTTQPLLRRAAG